MCIAKKSPGLLHWKDEVKGTTLTESGSSTLKTFFQVFINPCSVYSFSSSCPKTVSRTREVFSHRFYVVTAAAFTHKRLCTPVTACWVIIVFVFFLERKVPAQSKLKRVTLQPLALRTRFDHLKARFVFPGKRSWLAEGYWHMLLEAI